VKEKFSWIEQHMMMELYFINCVYRAACQGYITVEGIREPGCQFDLVSLKNMDASSFFFFLRKNMDAF
jgi:hypothetical protein